MIRHRGIVFGAATLASGQVIGQGLSFVRNVIIARLIGPAEFGIAVTFAIVVALLEMISNLSADKLLVQADDGDDPQFQGTAQLMQAGRGLVLAGILFALAWPASMLFQVPEARWAFQCLAIVPLLRGFEHLDAKRLHRQMQFGPSVCVEVIPQALATALAWPLAIWLGNYTAVLWLVLGQSAAMVVVTHLVSKRKYIWTWHSNYARRIITFGWPLLINGLLMFGFMHGDRLIVGSAYTPSDLGLYSVAFLVTFTPTMLIARVGSSLTLPLLASVKNDKDQFAYRYARCAGILSLIAIVVSIPLMLVGGPLVTLAFGSQYTSIGDVVACLAAMQAIRILRVAPTLAATAVGDTRNLMIANLARTTALVGALYVAVIGGDLVLIALSGLLGESLALAVSLARLRKRQEIPVGLCLRPTGIVAIALAAAACVVVAVGIPELTGGLVTSMMIVGIAVTIMQVVLRKSRSQEQATIANLLATGGEVAN